MSKVTTTSEKTPKTKKASKSAASNPVTSKKASKTTKPSVAAPEKETQKLVGENTTFTVTFTWAQVEQAQQKALEKAQSSAKLEGFRKGKAPLALIAKTMGEKGVRDATLETVLPDMYRQGLTEHKYLPLTDPEVRLESIEPNQDWTVTFIIATAPEINLEGYETVVTELKKSHQAWKKPAKDDEKKQKSEEGEKEENTTSPEAEAEAKRGEQINAVIEALLNKFPIVIPELLVRTETQRRLQDLGKQLEQFNMSVDDYLARSQKTLEQIQQEMATQSLLALQVEMLLGGLIRFKKLTVDHDLVHKALPTNREVSQAEHDYVESVLLKQAAVEHLLTL
jgi:FKBP-type peptidyl-prolyl cis-trans isomerase (trigger factor)